MSAGESSRRLIDQRVRNRIIEQLQVLSRGEECVEWEGPEWVEGFFDHFPYEGGSFGANSAISAHEWVALRPVLRAMQDLVANGAGNLSERDLIASGWPRRIQPLAKTAFEVFVTRGRFSEDVEEDVPSFPATPS